MQIRPYHRVLLAVDRVEIEAPITVLAEGDHEVFQLVRDSLASAREPLSGILARLDEERRSQRGDPRVIENNPYLTGKLAEPRPWQEDRDELGLEPFWCAFLYHLVRRFRPGTCIELGTAYGLSTLHLLAALVESDYGHLYTIEGEPERRAQALRSIKATFPQTERITSLEGLFHAQLPELLGGLETSVDLVFEDGPHIPETTESVFEQLWPRVREGGLMLFDDIRHDNGNYAAWSRIAQHESVCASIEVNGRLGLCVRSGRGLTTAAPDTDLAEERAARE